MSHRARRFVVVLTLGAIPLLGGLPASGQITGSCTVTFNGIDVERIDSLDTPLELDTSDSLVFAGSSNPSVQTTRVRLLVGPVTFESRSSSGIPVQEFVTSIPLADVAPYGVGLFRVVGEVDGCTATAWVRVSGRFPLTTVAGLVALGMALGGMTGQLGAVVSRSQWARSAASLGGIATGTGFALLAQQFGVLQVSYPSLFLSSALAASIGLGAAWSLNPTLREARMSRNRVSVTRPPVPAGPAARPQSGSAKREDRFGAGSEPASPIEPPADRPYWCYVMAPTDVFDLEDHTRTIARLLPGTWYLAKRNIDGWVHVVAANGEEGWVAISAVHRQR